MADGIYTGDGNRDIDFLGKAITVQSENGPDNCIIDCNGTWEEPHRGFYFGSGESLQSVLAGVTVTRGNYLRDGNGGAILCQQTAPLIRNCIIRGNCAAYGAIALIDSNAIISSCCVRDNFTQGCGSGAAGIFVHGGATLIEKCSITNNVCMDRYGGGVGLLDTASVLSQCLIYGNKASEGGAIDCRFSTFVLIESCTIADNRAARGGGINLNEGEMILSNCILYANAAASGAQAQLRGNFNYISCLTMRYCDVQHTTQQPGIEVSWQGEYEFEDGNVFIHPEFIADAVWNDNGTPNRVWDDHLEVPGDYRLDSNSPCIDAGDPNYILDPNCPNDLDGLPRIIGGRIDMGCYEFDSRPIIATGLWFFPRTINCNSRPQRILAVLQLPGDIEPNDVSDEPLTIYPYDIQSKYNRAYKWGRGRHARTMVMAVFNRNDLCDALPQGRNEVQVTGQLTTGRYFYGTTTIKITTPKPKLKYWPFHRFRRNH